MKNKFFIIVVLVAKALTGYGQAGAEVHELVRIAEMYNNIADLSFQVYYTYDDVEVSGDFSDEMYFECRISYGKMFITNEEMEILEGREHLVYVDKEDSVMMIYPQRERRNILEIPLLDSLFLANHVTGMSITNPDSTTRKLSVTFKPASNYEDYEIRYHPVTGLIKKISYHVRNTEGFFDAAYHHPVRVVVDLTDYVDNPFSPEVFNENRYFYKLNGSYYVQAAWHAYEIQE